MNKKISYEDALKRLEEIIKLLENGESPLDESLALYEEGVKLVKICSDRLDAAEERVRILTTDRQKENGEYEDGPFNPAE